MKKLSIIISIIVLLLFGFFAFQGSLYKQSATTVWSTVITQKVQTTFSYNGKNGIDALTLLKKYATVQQDTSGLVVSINGNKPTGHTYWAFYMNGKYAQVGPAQYKTKDTDKIEWKVEKY